MANILFGVTTQYTLMYDDQNSGATLDGAFYRPLAPSGWYILGDYAQQHYGVPLFPSMIVRVEDDDPENPALKPPTGYYPVWNDSGSGATLNGSIWAPIPPNGYAALGCVANNSNDGTQPDVPSLRCVRLDLLTTSALNSPLIWNDRNSGAKESVAVYAIVGLSTFWGVSDYTTPIQGANVFVNPPWINFFPTIDYTLMYSDKGSDADMDGAFWRPNPPASGWYIIGDYAQGDHDTPTLPSLCVCVTGDDAASPVLKAPTGYTQVWNDTKSGADMNGSIWNPIPPSGYIALGAVSQTEYTTPSISTLRCVRADLVQPGTIGPLIWNDDGSGATESVEAYSIIGSTAFYAQDNYDTPTGPVYVLAAAAYRPVGAPSWAGVAPLTLACPTSVTKSASTSSHISVEPSGLTIRAGRLYTVSDSGALLTAPLGEDGEVAWVSQYVPPVTDGDKSNDFESITNIGTSLMVGVEGFAKDDSTKVPPTTDATDEPLTPPQLRQFTPSSTPQNYDIGQFGWTWFLAVDPTNQSNNSGMEGLTFVPNGSYPAAWLTSSAYYSGPDYSPALGGIFFIALQSLPGKLLVYDLPVGGATKDNPVNSIGFIDQGLSPLLVSDLCFDADSGRLFVLYDGSAAAPDSLQILVIDASATLGSGDGHSQGFVSLYENTIPYYGCEGVTVDGNDLYLAVDLSSTQSSSNPPLLDGVYLFPNLVSALLGTAAT